MTVGRKRVVPVERITSRAFDMSASVMPGSLKSTPAKPLTWISTKPGAM